MRQLETGKLTECGAKFDFFAFYVSVALVWKLKVLA